MDGPLVSTKFPGIDPKAQNNPAQDGTSSSAPNNVPPGNPGQSGHIYPHGAPKLAPFGSDDSSRNVPYGYPYPYVSTQSGGSAAMESLNHGASYYPTPSPPAPPPDYSNIVSQYPPYALHPGSVNPQNYQKPPYGIYPPSYPPQKLSNYPSHPTPSSSGDTGSSPHSSSDKPGLSAHAGGTINRPPHVPYPGPPRSYDHYGMPAHQFPPGYSGAYLHSRGHPQAPGQSPMSPHYLPAYGHPGGPPPIYGGPHPPRSMGPYPPLSAYGPPGHMPSQGVPPGSGVAPGIGAGSGGENKAQEPPTHLGQLSRGSRSRNNSAQNLAAVTGSTSSPDSTPRSSHNSLPTPAAGSTPVLGGREPPGEPSTNTNANTNSAAGTNFPHQYPPQIPTHSAPSPGSGPAGSSPAPGYGHGQPLHLGHMYPPGAAPPPLHPGQGYPPSGSPWGPRSPYHHPAYTPHPYYAPQPQPGTYPPAQHPKPEPATAGKNAVPSSGAGAVPAGGSSGTPGMAGAKDFPDPNAYPPYGAYSPANNLGGPRTDYPPSNMYPPYRGSPALGGYYPTAPGAPTHPGQYPSTLLPPTHPAPPHQTHPGQGQHGPHASPLNMMHPQANTGYANHLFLETSSGSTIPIPNSATVSPVSHSDISIIGASSGGENKATMHYGSIPSSTLSIGSTAATQMSMMNQMSKNSPVTPATNSSALPYSLNPILQPGKRSWGQALLDRFCALMDASVDTLTEQSRRSKLCAVFYTSLHVALRPSYGEGDALREALSTLSLSLVETLTTPLPPSDENKCIGVIFNTICTALRSAPALDSPLCDVMLLAFKLNNLLHDVSQHPTLPPVHASTLQHLVSILGSAIKISAVALNTPGAANAPAHVSLDSSDVEDDSDDDEPPPRKRGRGRWAKHGCPGPGMVVRADGVRLKGKLDRRERMLLEEVLQRIEKGDLLVAKGDLAKQLRIHINPDRPVNFFEKLVARKKLNQRLSQLLLSKASPLYPMGSILRRTDGTPVDPRRFPDSEGAHSGLTGGSSAVTIAAAAQVAASVEEAIEQNVNKHKLMVKMGNTAETVSQTSNTHVRTHAGNTGHIAQAATQAMTEAIAQALAKVTGKSSEISAQDSAKLQTGGVKTDLLLSTVDTSSVPPLVCCPTGENAIPSSLSPSHSDLSMQILMASEMAVRATTPESQESQESPESSEASADPIAPVASSEDTPSEIGPGNSPANTTPNPAASDTASPESQQPLTVSALVAGHPPESASTSTDLTNTSSPVALSSPSPQMFPSSPVLPQLTSSNPPEPSDAPEMREKVTPMDATFAQTTTPITAVENDAADAPDGAEDQQQADSLAPSKPKDTASSGVIV